ncbi:MAG: hypothetical protein JWO36_5625 [Myxococcales bacterium]|nr:hypothetical protein [Myxococcales bacterium]
MATKGYKRSWKNLLLNKRYQLRFTLFMVGLAAVLMSVLGLWVMKEANEATTVAMARVRGEACPKVPVLNDPAGDDDGAQVPLKLPDEGSAAAAAGSAVAAPPADKPKAEHDPMYLAAVWCADAGLTCTPDSDKQLVLSGPDCDGVVAGILRKHDIVAALIAAKVPSLKCELGKQYAVPKTAPDKSASEKAAGEAVEPEHHVKVQIDESSMTLTPTAQTVPNNYIELIVGHWTCELRQGGSIDSLESGRMRILWVLIGTGILLMIGLAVYGIKMTHKVAGPLFKVGLYLAKMREGRFDKVYNLRKGDQLVDFYDHFKLAHAGVVQLERDDIDRIKAVIAAAEEAGAGDHEAIAELRKALVRKEKSLE